MINLCFKSIKQSQKIDRLLESDHESLKKKLQHPCPKPFSRLGFSPPHSGDHHKADCVQTTRRQARFYGRPTTLKTGGVHNPAAVTVNLRFRRGFLVTMLHSAPQRGRWTFFGISGSEKRGHQLPKSEYTV